MEQSRRIEGALRSRLRGDVLFDRVTREIYSTAACIYRQLPMGIVRPRDREDLVRLVELAGEEGLSLHPRGGGSGLTGGALGEGIICDLGRYFDRIGPVDPATRTVKVEPGVTLSRLNRLLEPRGLFFAPDPSSQDYCTLGGMVANNSGGARSVRYGSTRDHLESLEVVLADGRLLTLGAIPESELPPGLGELPGLLEEAEPLLEKNWPRTTKNSAGYWLPGVRRDGQIDLPRLLSGSEGTLGIVTGATLCLSPLPAHRSLLLLFFDDLDKAGQGVLRLREHAPSMLEIMDVTFIEAVRDSSFRVPIELPRELQALLLVEFEGESQEETAERMEAASGEILKAGLAFQSRKALDPVQQERLRAVRKASSAILNRMPRVDGPFPVRFIEDGAVPPERLPEYIRALHRLLEHHDAPSLIFGHAGDGNLHLNPFLDRRARRYPAILNRIADDVYALIRDLGGTTTGEHGDGWLRTPYLPLLYGPLTKTFDGIKELFDPRGLLNPGKIAHPAGRPLTGGIEEPHRRWSGTAGTTLDRPSLQESGLRCTGCGACRDFCPVFQAEPAEEFSPRARMILAGGIIGGDRLELGPEEQSAAKRILEACLGCRRCERLCPCGAAVPDVIQASRSQELGPTELPWRDRLLARPDHSLRLLAALGPMASLARNPLARGAAERLVGLDRSAPLPTPGGGRLERREPAEPGVIYYAGCATRYLDPDGEGAAALELLDRSGVTVAVPELGCCGLPSAVKGDRATARRQYARLLEELGPQAAAGRRILVSCPSCATALIRIGPDLLPGSDSTELAEAVTDLHAWLADRLPEDLPWRPLPERVIIHTPCHAHELGWGDGVLRLLARIPGLEAFPGPDLCCGMGGSFGLARGTAELGRRVSRRLGRELRAQEPDRVVSACQSCLLQLGRELPVPVEHPLTLVRRSLGAYTGS